MIGAPELAGLSARSRTPKVIAFAALTSAMIENRAPAAIALAVFGADPDAFRVLSRLARLGYAGRVLALAPPLPRRNLVERELRAQAPRLRLRVVCVAALAEAT